MDCGKPKTNLDLTECFRRPRKANGHYQLHYVLFDWRHPDVLKFNTNIIKYLSSNTSCFIVREATCFGPYVTIIGPSYESS